MPRVSRAQTEHNRSAIEAAAAALFRERGFAGVSVADLMAVAGLTHGGFYGHFASKDALAACACSQAFDESVRRWDQRAEGARSPREALNAIITTYLTAGQRDHAAQGCPAAAFAGDVARLRKEGPIRVAYLAGIKSLCEVLTALNPEGEPQSRQAALVQLSTLVGALLLARATEGDPISEELLDSARAALLSEGS